MVTYPSQSMGTRSLNTQDIPKAKIDKTTLNKPKSSFLILTV